MAKSVMPNWWFILVTLGLAGTAGAVLSGSGYGGGTVFWGVMLAGSAAAGLMWLLFRMPETDTARPEPAAPATLPSGFGQALLNQLPTPVIVVAARGQVSYVNAAARAAISRIEVGVHIASVFRAPAFIEGVDAVLRDDAPRSVEFTAYHPSERTLRAQVSTLPESGDFGPGRQVMVLLEDLTEVLRTERMRSDFVANASHELRTPLASIIGYIETLRGHAKDDPDARERFLGIMDKQAARMQRLVQDLMSLSRIEMTEHVRPDSECDLWDIVRDAVAVIDPLKRRHGAQVDVHLPKEAPAVVLADRDQLNQAIVNLIENAMRYGGEAPHVTISAAEPDPRYPGMVGVSVTDTGPGIERHHLHRLTERFYRVSPQKSVEKGGTGLGLAIVKHTLGRHGGEVAIQSEPGKGSCFTIWLPYAVRHDENTAVS